MTQPDEKQKSEYELARDAAAEKESVRAQAVTKGSLFTHMFSKGADWAFEWAKAYWQEQASAYANEVSEIRQQLEAERAQNDRLSKMYLEMRDGHEHVVHRMHAELTAANAKIETLKFERGTAQLAANGWMKDYEEIRPKLTAANALIEKLGEALEQIHDMDESVTSSDEDCTWGPAMGVRANEAKRLNTLKRKALAQLEQWRKERA